VYVEYSAPLYRVRVGNFVSKEDALRFREKAVQSGYEGAWVVEALIERE
jgi:cell division protein FtsN